MEGVGEGNERGKEGDGREWQEGRKVETPLHQFLLTVCALAEVCAL